VPARTLHGFAPLPRPNPNSRTLLDFASATQNDIIRQCRRVMRRIQEKVTEYEPEC